MIRLLYFGYRIYCFIFHPKPLGVRVMLIRNEEVLLVRQTYMPGWFMPGGGVKRGETLWTRLLVVKRARKLARRWVH